MITSDSIRFTVFRDKGTDPEEIIVLEGTVDHAGNLVKDTTLLSILMDISRRLTQNSYRLHLEKEGDDK